MSVIPDFRIASERDKWIQEHAEYWTTVRFRGRGHYERREFKDLSSAMAAARRMVGEANSRPVMIYAVSGTHDTFVTSVVPEGE